jgi:thiol-disulfide isomerase/thioredoxin
MKTPARARRKWLKLALGIISAPVAFNAYSALDVGQRISPPNIELLDGKSVSAAQMHGKVVAYLFWATWCPVCVGELPAYEQLRTQYRNAGLEVLAISLDQDPATVAAFQKQHGHDLPMAMRTDAIRDVFGSIKGTPTLFLVDRKGILRLKHLGGIEANELERQIRKVL